jgi:hypothetical protein
MSHRPSPQRRWFPRRKSSDAYDGDTVIVIGSSKAL